MFLSGTLSTLNVPFCTATAPSFVLPEPKMEAERGSVVKTACVVETAILFHCSLRDLDFTSRLSHTSN